MKKASHTIRPARPADLHALVELGRSTFEVAYREHFRKDFSLDALERFLDLTFSEPIQQKELQDSKAQFHVIEAGEKIVGYSKAVATDRKFPYLSGPSICIERIYVDSAHQNQGLGARLLSQIESYAQKQGAKILYLGVWDGNTSGIRFYLRNGFKAFDKEVFKITGSDFQDFDLMMFKALNSKDDLRLIGNHIYLRRHENRDMASHKEVLNDEETMRALKPFFKVEQWTDQMVRDRYDKFDSNPTTLMFSVCRKKDDLVVGGCGFKNLNLHEKSAEFGLILHRSVWGTGVATECHLLCLEYAFEKLRLKRIYFTTDSWNERMKGFFKKFEIPQTKKTEEGWLYFELAQSFWPNTRKLLQGKN